MDPTDNIEHQNIPNTDTVVLYVLQEQCSKVQIRDDAEVMTHLKDSEATSGTTKWHVSWENVSDEESVKGCTEQDTYGGSYTKLCLEDYIEGSSVHSSIMVGSTHTSDSIDVNSTSLTCPSYTSVPVSFDVGECDAPTDACEYVGERQTAAKPTSHCANREIECNSIKVTGSHNASILNEHDDVTNNPLFDKLQGKSVGSTMFQQDAASYRIPFSSEEMLHKKRHSSFPQISRNPQDTSAEQTLSQSTRTEHISMNPWDILEEQTLPQNIAAEQIPQNPPYTLEEQTVPQNIPAEQIPQNPPYTSEEQTVPQNTPAEQIPQKMHDTSTEQTLPQNTPAEQIPQNPQDTSTEQTLPQNIPAEQIPQNLQDTSEEQTLPHNTPVEQIPQKPQDTSTEQTLPQNIPAEQIPQNPQDTSEEQTLPQNTPVEQIPHNPQDTSTEKILPQNTSAEQIPQKQNTNHKNERPKSQTLSVLHNPKHPKHQALFGTEQTLSNISHKSSRFRFRRLSENIDKFCKLPKFDGLRRMSDTTTEQATWYNDRSFMPLGSTSVISGISGLTASSISISEDWVPDARPAHSSLPHIGFSARNEDWNRYVQFYCITIALGNYAFSRS